jgi:hypothetical protein
MGQNFWLRREFCRLGDGRKCGIFSAYKDTRAEARNIRAFAGLLDAGLPVVLPGESKEKIV